MSIEKGSNCLLYNFHDTPEDLYTRMRINRDIHAKLGVRIWSFLMRYQPVTCIDRSHVGPKWTWYELRAFQIMLALTHGAVSASARYFDLAYGEHREAFRALLLTPLAFLWHRKHYALGAGRPTHDDFERKRARLSPTDTATLRDILAAAHSAPTLRLRCQAALESKSTPWPVREVLPAYAVDPRGAMEPRPDPQLTRRLREGVAIEDADALPNTP